MSIASLARSVRLVGAPSDGVEHLGELVLEGLPPPAAPAGIVHPLGYTPDPRSVGDGGGSSAVRAEWGSESPPHQGRRMPHPSMEALAPSMAAHQLPLVGTPHWPTPFAKNLEGICSPLPTARIFAHLR